MKAKYKIVPVEPTDEMLTATGYWDCKSDVQHYELSKVYQSMVSASPEQPSDLEIVQKALQSGNDLQLRASGYDWFVVDGSEIIDSGNDFAALLTWAKQTVGHE